VSKTKLLLQKNGPGGYDIYVDPTALRTVSGYFTTRLLAFSAKQGPFAASTTHQDGEFGKLPLPETNQVNGQYVSTRQDAIKSLGDVTSWLGLIAGALTTSADDYEQSDGVGG
jgi:hypothetical protein